LTIRVVWPGPAARPAGAAHHRPIAVKFPAVKDMTLEQKIGVGFWVGVVVFMLSQILLVVFAIAFFLGHFVWPQ
jgi:hypothetical protein